jgi:GMP synthase (glutamine-hydrolysing)
MSARRLLVMDGNRVATRSLQREAGGEGTGEGYATVLKSLAGGLGLALEVEIVCPADGEVRLAHSLTDYAGVTVTGSALSVYRGGPQVERQLELVRAVFDCGVPLFGSCWGLQLAVTAAGGTVSRNPRGREFGIGRRILLTEAGRAHAMYAGKDSVFEAIVVHRDEIAALPPQAIELARNEMGVQALEVRHKRGTCWAVQYHPEYGYAEIAATARRYGDALITEGVFADAADLQGWVADLRALDRTPGDRRLNWRHGIGPGLSENSARRLELVNWLQQQVIARGPR